MQLSCVWEMGFDNKHFCGKCGKLLFKSAGNIIGQIQIMCSRSNCKTIQVVCDSPEQIEGSIIPINAKNSVYSADRERVKEKFREFEKVK